VKHTELQKVEIIEPEVITPEDARPFERRVYTTQNNSGFLGNFFSAVFTFSAGAVMFLAFLAVFILLAAPMLLLNLFGKKPNIKIFKYHI
jgi:hypothetical protein